MAAEQSVKRTLRRNAVPSRPAIRTALDLPENLEPGRCEADIDGHGRPERRDPERGQGVTRPACRIIRWRLRDDEETADGKKGCGALSRDRRRTEAASHHQVERATPRGLPRGNLGSLRHHLDPPGPSQHGNVLLEQTSALDPPVEERAPGRRKQHGKDEPREAPTGTQVEEAARDHPRATFHLRRSFGCREETGGVPSMRCTVSWADRTALLRASKNAEKGSRRAPPAHFDLRRRRCPTRQLPKRPGG